MRGCEVSNLIDTQNLTEHGPEQSAVVDPAFSWRVEIGDL